MIEIVILAIVAFFQNMAFTWSSRSRASGDPNYHRWAAVFSNGIWFVCQVFIIKSIWSAVTSQDWPIVVIAGLVYTVATTEGSVFMMKILIKKEKGAKRVGHYGS